MGSSFRPRFRGIGHRTGVLLEGPLAPIFLFAAACSIYLLLSVKHPLFHPARELDFFDLRVYRGGARLILDSKPLYDTQTVHSYFTYPPASGLLFAPLALVSLSIAEIIATITSLALLVMLLRSALALEPVAGWLRKRRSSACTRPTLWVGLLAGSLALWLEPVVTTLAYGQVDLLIATLVVCDLARSDGAKTKGVLIGLAAGLKLTPIIFAAYLLFGGRRRAAIRALVCFAATVVLGFVLLAEDSERYWNGVFLDASRVGSVANPANQSIRGSLARLLHTVHVDSPWLALAVLVGVIGLTLAVLASRRGDEATGFSLCAITGLLVSPISWTHHWTLAVPALLLLFVAAFQYSSPLLLAGGVLAAGVGWSYATWWVSRRGSHELHLGVGGLLAADPFVLLGLGTLAAACWLQFRHWS